MTPETQITRCIKLLCQMPDAFHARGNSSMVGLIAEACYSAVADAVTEGLLTEHLRRHPELVTSWLAYSEDQRCTPACGLSQPDTVGGRAKGWRVFCRGEHVQDDWDRTFPDQFTACAFFIKRHAEQLISIHPRRWQP